MFARVRLLAVTVLVVTASRAGVAGSILEDPADPDVNPLNHAPLAQAGPASMVVDGGTNDEDDAEDGEAQVRLDGTRSRYPDRGSLNETPCQPQWFLTPYRSDYRWFEGEVEDNETPSAGGSRPLIDLGLGVHEFTLVVEDDCDARDRDPVRVFVGSSQRVVAERTFDGADEVASIEAPWTRTSACGLSGGPYLAFTQTSPDGCSYRTENRVIANATLPFSVPDADALGLSFRTQWDTREGVTATPEDLLRTQLRFENEDAWTPANLTFAYERGDEERSESWVRATGIFDLRNRSVSPGVTVTVRFQVDTGTAVDETDASGWFVDDVTVWELRI